jgi:predicted transposase/invertase (TIGR01784 family)
MKEMKRLDRWLGYLSKKLNDEEREVLAMAEKSIRNAMEAETFFTQDDIKRWEYEHREDALRDYRSDMRASREEGRAEGLVEAKTDVVLKMLKKNMDVAVIAEVTGMSITAIQELAK